MKDNIKNAVSNAKLLSEKEIRSIAGTGLNENNLIVDVFDAYVYDSKGVLLMKAENLTESGISASADQEEIRNGKGNKVFAIINKNKNLEVTLTENIFNFNSLAYKNGTKVVKGDGVATMPTQRGLKVSSGKTITLPKAPKYPSKLVYYKNGEVVTGSCSETTATLTEVAENDLIDVEPYEYDVTGVDKIVIKADEFPSANRLILHTIEIDPNMKHVANIFIVMDRATPNGTWEINPGSERQATNSTYTFKIAANENEELASILRETV